MGHSEVPILATMKYSFNVKYVKGPDNVLADYFNSNDRPPRTMCRPLYGPLTPSLLVQNSWDLKNFRDADS